MRNHKNLMFWEELIRVLVRSYRFATSLPGNDQFTLGTEIKRQAVRVRTKIVAAGSIESSIESANALDLESLDRLAGAVFSYRRSMS